MIDNFALALTHGLMWSVIAPIGVRLVPASHAGRATTAVYAGTALALVVAAVAVVAHAILIVLGFALLLWADQRRRLASGDRSTARASIGSGSRAALRIGVSNTSEKTCRAISPVRRRSPSPRSIPAGATASRAARCGR